MQPLGVILAGGGALRMGTDKALVEVGGRPMIEWVAGALRAVTPDLIVVGRAGTLAGVECVPDDGPARRGPLAGLAVGLGRAGDRPALTVAVDQPWVRIATMQGLLDLAGPVHAVVPIDRDSRQVTCALYPGSWLERVAAEDAAGGSIQALLDDLPYRPVEENEWRAWGEDGRSWFSVNTKKDRREGIERFGNPG